MSKSAKAEIERLRRELLHARERAEHYHSALTLIDHYAARAANAAHTRLQRRAALNDIIRVVCASLDPEVYGDTAPDILVGIRYEGEARQ